MGIVLTFPQPPAPTCYDCQHVCLGASNSWCDMYGERIWSESVAAECDEFQPFEDPVERINAAEDND